MIGSRNQGLTFGILIAAFTVAVPAIAQESPGGAIVVSTGLISNLVARPIDESQDISQTVMGTYTEGTVVTKGRLDAQFLPANGYGLLELRLLGTATLGSGVGYNGPVTIYSSSRTSIDARKRILLTSSGLRWQPSDVQCSTQIVIHAIEAHRRVIERMAWRRAGRMQGSVEQAASWQGEIRTGQSIDRLVNRGLATGNDMIHERLGPSGKQLDLASRLRINTTSARLFAVMFPSADIAVDLGPHPRIDPRADGGIVLHEVLVGDVGRTLLSGSTVSDKEMLSLMNLLVGSHPRPLWVHAREPRWKVTFAKAEPLSVRFSDGQVRFRLTIDRVEIDGQETVESMVVAADYQLEISEDGPVLIRRGHVRVLDEFENKLPELSIGQQFMRRKFRGVFLPKIRFLGLIPPAGSNWAPLRGLELKQLTSHNGWLTLVYEIAPDTKRAPLPIMLAPTAEMSEDSVTR